MCPLQCTLTSKQASVLALDGIASWVSTRLTMVLPSSVSHKTGVTIFQLSGFIKFLLTTALVCMYHIWYWFIPHHICW